MKRFSTLFSALHLLRLSAISACRWLVWAAVAPFVTSSNWSRSFLDFSREYRELENSGAAAGGLYSPYMSPFQGRSPANKR